MPNRKVALVEWLAASEKLQRTLTEEPPGSPEPEDILDCVLSVRYALDKLIDAHDLRKLISRFGKLY